MPIQGKRRGTLKQLGVFLREECGIPISDSTLQKRTAPSCDSGPPVAYWFGKKRIFDFEEGKAWAEAELRPGSRKRVAFQAEALETAG
jgi:hypothetical protein